MYYFDHSATTPIRKEVLDLMQTIETNQFGNPSSIHRFGQQARNVVETARKQTAAAIGARSYDIVFTGGGTEANNMVLWNILYQNKQHVITSAIEHPAILNVLKNLKRFGLSYDIIPVDKYGIVNLNKLEKAIRKDTGLISIMLANNEVGSIQPLEEIIALARNYTIPVHSDAVQTLGKIPVNVNVLDIDVLSFAAHKFYGPKGTGFLYIRKGRTINPHVIGGGQERKIRAGTENVPGIAGMGLAAQQATESVEESGRHLIQLADQFISGISKNCPYVKFNGHPEKHLPGLVSMTIPGVTSDVLMIRLDRDNIAISNGSACSSGTIEPSHVLNAMHFSITDNISTLRISFGKDNNSKDVNYLIEKLTAFIQYYRNKH